MRTKSRTARALVLLGLVAGLTPSCASWRVAQEEPSRLLLEKPQRTLRVTLAGAEPVVLQETRVSADTLYGRTDTWPAGIKVRRVGSHLYHVAIPNGHIQQVEIRKTSAIKTAVLIAVLGASVASIIVGPRVATPPFQ